MSRSVYLARGRLSADDRSVSDVTGTDESTEEFDPLAYESGDRVGLCLDVDGTTYRTGSVFVEALAYLPYADAVTLSRSERRHRRTALLAVAGYRSELLARIKWQWTLWVLDALRVGGADSLSETVLTALARRTADHQRDGSRRSSGPPPAPSPGAYRSMRQTVLSAYGRLLRGKRATDVERTVADVVARRCPVDPQLRATLDHVVRESETDLYLITDAPEHVATAYARNLCGDAARVIGTSYETDGRGRYTGRYDPVDKGDAVAQLRADRQWEFVVAAGDSAADATMADAANVFLAVAGQGDLRDRLTGVSLRGSVRDVRLRLGAGSGVVRVRRDEDFATALATTLRAVGVLPSPD